MTMNIIDVFKELSGDEFVLDIKDTQVASLSLSEDKKRMTVRLECSRYIAREALHYAEISIREKYRLSAVRIEPRFPKECFCAEVMPDEITEMKRRISSVNGSFNGCRWSYDEKNAAVHAALAFESRPMLRAQDFEEKMAQLLREEFGVNVSVILDYDEQNAQPQLIEQARQSVAAAAIESARAASHADETPPWESAPEKEEQPKRRWQSKLTDEECEIRLPENVKYVKDIYGKKYRMPFVRISELSNEYSRAAVWGEVFNYNLRVSKSGETHIISFCVTDKTSSCVCKLLVPASKADTLTELKNGAAVIVQGEYLLDTYDREYTIKVKYIALAQATCRMDNAEEKRVELHMHTNMSRMDAVSPVEEIVKRAAKWGHKAIAITDHGVVQAFPGAMNAAADCAKSDMPIKVIYGTEAYFVNDVLNIFKGRSSMPVTGRFVVFDLETTGLSPAKERITEIGAVTVENGEITDSFSSFVNPRMPIPADIIALTGITDDMVRDAPPEEDAVRDFLEYVGDSILVAHNASFDVGFLNAACERIGLDFHNEYIDTLALSKVLYPELSKFSLDSIVKHLKQPEFDHHRAKDDAQALAGVFIEQLEDMGERFNVKTTDEINKNLIGSDSRKLRSHHMIILVRNLVGLKNLYKLVSYAHVRNFYKQPRIIKSELMELREGLIIGSACEAGELFDAVRRGARWSELLEIADFYDYLEIQPLCNNAFMLRNGSVADEQGLIDMNKTICKLGKALKKPVIATCDAHYIDEEDDLFRRVLLNELGMPDSNVPAKLFLRTTDEMLSEFKYLGSKEAYDVVVRNPNIIADMVENIKPIPPGTYPPSIAGSDDSLRRITNERAREIYGDPLPDYVEKRLNKELDSIIGNGYSVMYMTAQLMVADSVEHGYLVGSRGSVGSSFVATMSGISEVNPLAPHYVCPSCKHSEFFINDESIGSGFDLPPKKCPQCGADYNRDGHDIPFETFLGFNGDKQPDIDLNFSNEYQSYAHRFVEKLFNTDTEKVFKAGTIGTVADKTAYKYALKYQETNDLHFSSAEVERIKGGCVGVKSTTGQHPGGMVVVPADKEIYDFCPVQHPANKAESGVLTTHFDFHAIHDTILKLDCLGHVGPTIYKYLEEFTGIKVTDVPMCDPDVMKLFTSTEPLGVKPEDIDSQTGTFSLPEVGTAFVRQMLIDTQPKTFSDLLQVSGLSHGTGVYLGNAKDLIAEGTCTISEVIGTRDNIMTYLIKKGVPNALAFKIMEIVRKGKSKKLLTKEMIEEMKAHGVPQWYIDSCFKIQYMFPKAHAAAYMISCLRLGWYKVHRATEYYAAYFTARCENFDADAAVGGVQSTRQMIKALSEKGKEASQTEEGSFALLQIILEAQMRGIAFLPVDLYKSDALKFLPDGKDLRLPFIALKGLGEAAALNLAKAGKDGEYISKAEIIQRSGVSKGIIEILDNAGVLKHMPESSQMSIFFELDEQGESADETN